MRSVDPASSPAGGRLLSGDGDDLDRAAAGDGAGAAIRAVRSHGRLVIDDADWPLYDAVLAEVGDAMLHEERGPCSTVLVMS